MRNVWIVTFLVTFLTIGMLVGSLFAANTMSTVIYSFTIRTDTTPPAISDRIPAHGEISVNPMAPISFKIWDSESGVDINSIVMKVNGQVVEPTITGDMYEFTVTYTPTIPFVHGSTVTISVTATDNAQ